MTCAGLADGSETAYGAQMAKAPLRSSIMQGLTAQENIMEAERLNTLEALLADLGARAVELRRYL
jgi:hypothetical protein